ncbi:hypothetical protein C0992_012576 [Termitomyces sp. T32_za158]|nr:hypothetical protein C0992_012576 [Termitomyces sp. T32_za158]
MALSATPSGKGKEKAIEPSSDSSSSDSSESLDSSDSEHSDSDSDSDDPVTPEYLESLLEKARQNYADAAAKEKMSTLSAPEEVITLDEDSGQKPLPQLDLGTLPPCYFELGATRFDGPSRVRDPGIDSAERASSSRAVPSPPVPPPELTKSGKPLTRKEKKEVRDQVPFCTTLHTNGTNGQLKNKTAGSDWFDLPAPAEADLPRLHREVEALRLRNQLDPKRFYRKDEGEGKGIKGLPKYFAVGVMICLLLYIDAHMFTTKVGTILPSSTPFGTASGENLTRANRKRTLVDELVDDAEAKRYAKKKFGELQSVRGAKGKNTLQAKNAMRRPKW